MRRLRGEEAARLRRIVDAIDAGKLEQAWSDLDEWGHDAPLDALVARFAAHDEVGALAVLARRRDRLSRRVHVDLAQRLGLEPEAQRILDGLLAEGEDPDLLRRAALPRERARAWRSAVGLLRRLVAVDPSLDHRLAFARCLTRLGEGDAADAWVRLLPEAPAEAVAGLFEAGAFDRFDDAHRGARARVALYRGELSEARRLGPDDALVLGAVEVLEGRGGERALRRALDERPDDAEAWTWLGRALLARGEVDAGREALDRALALAGTFHFPALLLRLTSEMEQDLDSLVRGEMPDRVANGGAGPIGAEVSAALVELWGRDPLADARDLPEVVRWLRRSVERLRGNLGPHATFVRDGALRRLRTRDSPREASRRALELVRVLPPAVAEAALDEVAARYPRSESPLVHRGELRLWLGRYEEAAGDFERALSIQPGTRWAYIGLGGARMLQGDLDEALRVQALGVRVMGSAIGSVFIYRGEALLRAGRLEEAARDLAEAERRAPTRLSAWIDRALLAHRRSDLAARDAWLERLMAHAPALLGDAGGRHLWAGSRQDVPGVLERARAALRGNRSSSCQTYVAPDGTLRLVGRPRLPQPRRVRRAELLAGVRRALR